MSGFSKEWFTDDWKELHDVQYDFTARGAMPSEMDNLDSEVEETGTDTEEASAALDARVDAVVSAREV